MDVTVVAIVVCIGWVVVWGMLAAYARQNETLNQQMDELEKRAKN